MCDPITLGVVAVGMAAGGGVSSIIGQNDARQLAKGEENMKKNAVDDQIIQNRQRATTDYLAQVKQEELKQDQEHMALAQKNQDVTAQATGASSTATASAAERGVGGRSVAEIVQSYNMQATQEIGRNRLNQQFADNQHSFQIGADERQYEQRAASIQPYVPKPQAPVDYFGPIFGIGKAAATAGMSMGAGAPGSTTPIDWTNTPTNPEEYR